MEKITLKELKKFMKAEAKRLNSDFEDVPQWVLASAVRLFNEKTAELPEQEILQALNNSISNDEFGDDKHILNFLRNADEKTLDEMAHGYEFEPFKGALIEIVMWQPLESFTLRQLASHIGL